MKIKFKHQTTQAYWAGCLTARLYNIYFRRNDLPSILLCMRDFRILRTLFGKYYNLLKHNQHIYPYINQYEKFNRLDLDKSLIGSIEDFMRGYADHRKKERLDVSSHSSN